MKNQNGLSLVEILVALVISVFLLGGVVQMYVANKATYGFSEAVSRIQENGRFAIDSITRDLRMAGFRGCATENFTNNLNPAGTGYDADLHDFFNEPSIEGTENLGTNGSDSLTIRGAAPGQANVVSPYNSPTSAQVFSNVNNFLEQDDIVILSNCLGADIFQITNITQGSGAVKTSVVHNTGAGSSPGNYNPGACGGGNAHCLSQTYGGDSAILKMQAISYFIGVGASGEPALFRTVFNDTSELVDGIEQMQVLYGVNTDTTNTVPNQYVVSTAVTDWDSVTAVRVMLLLKSTDNVTQENQTYTYNNQTITSGDSLLRQVFSTTVALRNRN